jgi:DTW domain-containing protein YfiP
MNTQTRFVFLMHPKEYKEEKAGTGRLTHLCLAGSELHVGVAFDCNEAVQSILADPTAHAVLLYPGPKAANVSDCDQPVPLPDGKRLTVLLLDATWSCARKMLRLSPSLQALPRLMFTPSHPSRYVIKQQPQAGCLSTLESVHELLLALEKRGLDRYEDPTQLLSLFDAMQEHQIRCASDPNRGGYRRQPYGTPEERAATAGRSHRRRYLGSGVSDRPTVSGVESSPRAC